MLTRKQMNMNEKTPAQQYAATMDSVNLINSGKPEFMDDKQWADCLKRNKQHLVIMLAKDYWTTEDLEPFRLAIAAI